MNANIFPILVSAALAAAAPAATTLKSAGPDGVEFEHRPRSLKEPDVLVVRRLAPGDWELRADGRLLGVFDADELAKGVDAMRLDSPNRRRALDPVLRKEGPVPFRVAVRRRAPSPPPVDVFVCMNNDDFADGGESLLRLARVLGEKTPCDFVTLSLRCRPDLESAEVRDLAKRFIAACHEEGIRVAFETDLRLAREGFLAAHPGEAQKLVVFGGRPPKLSDHMTGGTRGYDVTAEEPFDEASGARLFTLFCADVFAPHLDEYTSKLMREAKALGADTAMRDEWGFPPTSDEVFARHRAFWYSDAMAADYKARFGADLKADIVLMGTAPAGRDEERGAAIRRYEEAIYRRCAAIERRHYAETKSLFGPDAVVTKHSTWFPLVDRFDFQKNGLDWWAADRDIAQTDEITPVAVRLGLAKKTGGSVWMNEGYQDRPEKYLAAVKRYALSGGRMVFHRVYGGNWDAGLPASERRLRTTLSVFEQPGMVETLEKLRELDRTTAAQLDSPVALVFGHFEVMDWSSPAYRDWGAAVADGLHGKGWAVDAYPSTELQAGTFRVDAEGWLRVGHQRYRALVVKNLSERDLAGVRRMLGAKGVKTVLHVAADDAATVAAVDAQLAAAGAVKQPPLSVKKTFWNFGSTREPASSGTATLQDGTKVEF